MERIFYRCSFRFFIPCFSKTAAVFDKYNSNNRSNHKNNGNADRQHGITLRVISVSEHGNHLNRKRTHEQPCQAGKDTWNHGHGISLLFCAGKRWQHGPVRNINYSVSHTPENVHHRKIGVHAKSGHACRFAEHEDHHDRIQYCAEQNPRTEFAPFASGVIYNEAHHRIIKCIPDSGYQEQVSDEQRCHSNRVCKVDHQEIRNHRIAQVFTKCTKSK